MNLKTLIENINIKYDTNNIVCKIQDSAIAKSKNVAEQIENCSVELLTTADENGNKPLYYALKNGNWDIIIAVMMKIWINPENLNNLNKSSDDVVKVLFTYPCDKNIFTSLIYTLVDHFTFTVEHLDLKDDEGKSFRSYLETISPNDKILL